MAKYLDLQLFQNYLQLNYQVLFLLSEFVLIQDSHFRHWEKWM